MTSNVKPQAFDEDAYPDELRPGTELLHGQYVIEKFLNSGGFGITYLAKDSLDRTVVIKECFPGSFCRRSDTIVCVRSRAHQSEFQNIVKLFVQEAKNLAKLKHPNIVGVHQIFEDNDTAYMALDYIDGRDLLDILEDPNDAVSPADVQSITQKLLSAIEYVHKSGVLHRDVSPDNILLDRRTGEPVLIDFGAAREEATRQTRLLSAMRVVKDGYSPQEFYIQGSQQSPSSDLYALGATLYHVMTGECPPDSQSRLAAVAAQKADPYRAFPPELPGYDPKFLKAINQAMNIFPYDRIQTAAEWLKFITPEPEIVALPTQKIRPKRPTSVIADDSDLADHAQGGQASAVEPPVPSMVPAAQMETQPSDPGDARLDNLRHSNDAPAKKSSMGLMLGGVAAAALIGAVGAVFVLPEGTLTGGAAPETQNASAPTTTTQPAPATQEVAAVTQTPEVEPTPEIVFTAPEAVADVKPELVLEIEPVAQGAAPSLPALELSSPSASDVQISEAAPAAEVNAQAPVLSTGNPEQVVAANEDAATLAEQVQQAVVAALDPPKAPQTEAPEMLVKVSVLDQTPPVFAVIGSSELSSDRFLSLLQSDTQTDHIPSVDITSAEPLPEPKPEPVVVASTAPAALSLGDLSIGGATENNDAPTSNASIDDVSAVMTGWTVDLPFSKNPINQNVVEAARLDAPDWLETGTKIVAVNGQRIESIDEISSIASLSAGANGSDSVTVQVLYQKVGDSNVQLEDLTLQTARNVALLNGFQFKTVNVDGEWKTLVSVSPENGANALRAGDRLVAYIPTNERLDRETALSEIFERELNNGTSQFAFAVNRDGKLWVASLGYEGEVQK